MAKSKGTRPTHASGAISSEGNAAARQRPLSTASGAWNRGRDVSPTTATASPAPLPPTMATSPIACLPLVEASCERAFAPLHAARLRSRTFVGVAEEMQHAVDQQPIQLRTQRRGPLGRLAARAVERDDDVAQQAGRRPAGALGLGEGQDVRRPVLAAPVPV